MIRVSEVALRGKFVASDVLTSGNERKSCIRAVTDERRDVLVGYIKRTSVE